MSSKAGSAGALTLVLLLAAGAAAAQADPHAYHQAGPPPAAAGPSAAEIVALDVPDVPVLDQEGRPRRFHGDLVAGRNVAVNFIFTSCTTICPPLAATFGKLRQLLGERAGRDVHLISISVDPTTDTPERLAAWSRKFGAGPGWTLVTGRREDIAHLLKALGAYTADVNDHPPLVLIGNARGQWTRAYGLAAPAKLAAAIDVMVALGNAKTPEPAGESRP
jgi:protein SCO1